MARKEGDKWVSSDGSKWDSQGSAANADKASAASSGGNASESLIDGAGSILSGIGGAIGSAITSAHDKAWAKHQRKIYLEKGGAEFEEAQKAESAGDYDAAIDLYKKAAGKGLTDAFYAAALCSRDRKKNDAQAFAYFKKAADHSDSRAYFPTAVCYRDGIGTAKDDAQAFVYFKRKADHDANVDDKASAIIYVGVACREGIGTEKNTALAVEYLNKLAKDEEFAGDRMGEVLNHLGVCYRDGGPGLAPDSSKAIRYFKAAAGRRNEEAVANLDRMGVKYSRAAEGGNRFLSLLCAIACGFGIALFIDWAYVSLTGADKIPTIVSILFMVVFGIWAFRAARVRNRIALVLLAVAAFGWLYLFDILPEPDRAEPAQTEQQDAS